MTGVKLELLTDIDMHLFIEQGLRGDISTITHRQRIDVQLVKNQSKARKLTSKPSVHAFEIFNEDLVAIHMLK